MPKIKTIFYAENNISPVLDWIQSLSEKMQDKAEARITILSEKGHELRRPVADFLRDGVYELRWSGQRVNYRILYGFHENKSAILAHGLTKEKKVPAKDINIAIERLKNFRADQERFTYEEEQ